MGNSGAFSALLLLSVCRHCLQFELEHIWPGKSRHCVCAGEGDCQQHVCESDLHLVIGCDEPGAVDSCKSNYSHWVEPQTVDFYTADLYLNLLSDHYDNFSKHIKKIITDYSFNWSHMMFELNDMFNTTLYSFYDCIISSNGKFLDVLYIILILQTLESPLKFCLTVITHCCAQWLVAGPLAGQCCGIHSWFKFRLLCFVCLQDQTAHRFRE